MVCVLSWLERSALPERIVGTELALHVETSDAWIVERTGIRQRHVAAEGQLMPDLAIEAARRALGATVSRRGTWI